MATMITNECINCGACESECPNTAIYQGGVEWDLNGVKHAALAAETFYIVPEKCTECVGFHDQEACAAVCPVDCCIPNPDIPESEEQLIARSQQLHPETTFPPDFPSRFRKQGAQPAAAAAVTAPQPTAGAAAPAPVAPQPPAAPAAAAPAGAQPVAAPGAAGPPAPVAPQPVPAPAAAAAPLPTAAAAVPLPTAAAAPVTAAPEASPSLPPPGEWEVPIDCFRCGSTYGVPFRHVRSGVVLYCPSCNGSYVVSTSLYGNISRALAEFSRRWTRDFESFHERRCRELEEFEERQRRVREGLSQTLRRISTETKAPGAPKKRAWIFG